MSSLPLHFKAICSSLVLSFAVLQSASAQTAIQWTGTTNTTFSVGSNWSGGTAPADDLTTNTALFNGTVTANQPSITASRSIAGLDFQRASGGWTLGSGFSGYILTIGASGITSNNTSGVNIISPSVRLGANQTWTVGTGGQLRFSGATFNDNGYSANVTGAGTFDIRSTGGSTFSGQISTNTLSFNSNSNFTLTNAANSFTSLAIYSGRVKFSSIGNFGQASSAGTGGTSSTISIGASGGNAIFEYTGSTVTSNRSFTRDFRSTGSGIDVTTSGETLTLTGGMSNTGTAAADTSWNFGGAGNLVVNGVILNSGTFKNGINKTGAGTLTLGGNNTFTGNISIEGGSVVIGAAGRLAAGTYAGNISNSGTFTYSGTNAQTLSGIISGAGALNQSGSGALTLSGSNSYNGTTTVSAGTLRLGGSGGGNNTIAGNISITGGELNYSASNNEQIVNTADISISGGLMVVGARSETINTLTMTGGNLTMGNGTLTLGAASTLSGGTLTLSGATDGQINTSGTLTLGNSTLAFDHTSDSSDTKGLVLGGNITVSNGATANFSNSSTGLGRIELDGNREFSVGTGAAMNVGWVIDEFGGTRSLTKAGVGTLTVTAANSYAGATTISAGTLQIGNNGSTGTLSTSSAITNNGVLVINRSNDVAQGTDFSATAISGTGSFLQAGSGNTTLSSANTFSGSTRVDAGKLILANNLAIQNSAFDTGGSGTLELGAGIATPTLGGLIGSSNFLPTNYSSVTSLTLNTASGVSATYSGVLANGVAGTTLTKSGAGTQILSGANTYTGSTTITAGTLQIGSGGTTGSIATGSAITNNGILVFNRSNTVTQGTDFTATALEGTGALIQQGSGALIFSTNNTYTGATTISAGTLQLGNNGASGALSVSSTITNNGTLVFYRTNNATQGTDFSSAAIGGTGSLVQKGSSVLTLNVANTYSGGTVLESGTIAIGNASGLGNGTLTINGGRIGSIISNPNVTNAVVVGGDFSLNGLGQAIQLSGTMDLGGATRTITVDGNTANLRGVISNGGLVKSGAANMFLYANNTYTGGTTITSGTLFLQSNGALLSTGSVSLSGGRFDITNMTAASTSIGSLAGTAGSVNLGNKTLVVGLNNSDTTFAGTITSNGTANALTKNGTGTLTLASSNTYTGTTTLNMGTLVIGNTAAAGTGMIMQSNGSSLLKFDTTGTITNNMSIYNVLASQSATLSGAITVNNATFEVDSGDKLTISNTINGTGGVTKNGEGNLVLSGSNTYSGATTINSGTIEAASANALGSTSTVIVNGGSLLVGADNAIGDSADMTLAGGMLEFGGNITETLGSLTLTANSVIDMGGGNIAFEFSDMVEGLTNTTRLNIYNYTAGSDHLYFGSNTNLSSSLQYISFYSGWDTGLIGTGFISSFGSSWEVAPSIVPEPETWATAATLLAGAGVAWLRRRRKPSSF